MAKVNVEEAFSAEEGRHGWQITYPNGETEMIFDCHYEEATDIAANSWDARQMG